MSASKEAKPFDYMKSPDGEDVMEKIGVLAKPVTLTAFAFSTIDVMLYSHPKGYMNILARYMYVSWPIFGSATAFVLGHNLAGTIRHKDDKWNWFIGGAAAGSVFGVWRRSPMAGFVAAVACGMLALGKKHCAENGTHLLYPKELKVQYGGVRAGHYDWTLTRHIPGNWTTGEEKK